MLRPPLLLVLLHPLGLQDLPHTPPGLRIVGLHEPEALGRGGVGRLGAPERDHTLAADDLEPARFAESISNRGQTGAHQHNPRVGLVSRRS
jgi:hypothetical protein